MTDPKPKSSMSKFRAENPRIDYYPAADATAAIERLRSHHPDAPTRWLVDQLVLTGIKALERTEELTP